MAKSTGLPADRKFTFKKDINPLIGTPEQVEQSDQDEPTPPPAAAAQPVEQPAPPRSKGGRPRGTVRKQKFTYYLRAEADEDITAITKGLVKHADTLLKDKGEAVDQALSFMRFCLEDTGSRPAFLEIYQRWKDTSAEQ